MLRRLAFQPATNYRTKCDQFIRSINISLILYFSYFSKANFDFVTFTFISSCAFYSKQHTPPLIAEYA